MGYCLGGTLLAIARGGAGARRRRARSPSMTLLAAQTDFTEPGELALLHQRRASSRLLEDDDARARAYLDEPADGRRLRAAALAGPGLVAADRATSTSRAQRDADDRPDGLERRRHAHAVRACTPSTCAACTCDNELATEPLPGRRPADARCRDIRVPMFVVGTERDHVAPWQLGLQDPPAQRGGTALRAHHRWAQRGHRESARRAWAPARCPATVRPIGARTRPMWIHRPGTTRPRCTPDRGGPTGPPGSRRTRPAHGAAAVRGAVRSGSRCWTMHLAAMCTNPDLSFQPPW
ncbi:MAG: hypothetical protein MZW92_53995 [Comamonadaceae bacterium]|nr:hypothetical protein [Comamonadaceae bacterium]